MGIKLKGELLMAHQAQEENQEEEPAPNQIQRLNPRPTWRGVEVHRA